MDHSESKNEPAPAEMRDLDRALRIAGGSQQLADELFAQFCSELPDKMMAAQYMILNRDIARLREILHQIKGAAAVCAVTPLEHSLNELRDAVIADDEPMIEAGFAVLKQQTDRLIGSESG